MTILNDTQIKNKVGMIQTLHSEELEPLGYRIRLDWASLRRYRADTIVDAYQTTADDMVPVPVRPSQNGPYFEMRPGEFILGCSVERFQMPADILGNLVNRSSWERRGVLILPGRLWPGWAGHLVVELANVGANYVNVYLDLPIALVEFHSIEAAPLYHGLYQDQPAQVTL